MNNKFLDKVVDQIMSETSIIDNKLHAPFAPFFFPTLSPSSPPAPFSSHCKDVYSLNKEETKYVWTKYKEELTYE
tara:strand:- start:38 stop:262 length:225 start_codon:yes stop_codon:yes gene_type:complete